MPPLKPLAANNLLIYYGPLATVAGPNTIDAAIRFVSKFNYLVVGLQSGGDIANAQRIIQEAKRINPSFKWFGYTFLGGAASYGAWSTTMNAWATNFPGSLKPDGIFVDQFGLDWAAPAGIMTRAFQNQAITDVHAAGYSAFVNPFDPATVFGQNSGESAPIIGNDGANPNFIDYCLIESYYVSVADGATLEEPNKRIARLQILQWAQNNLKVQAAAVIGAGALLTVPFATWDAARKELAAYGIGIQAVGPSDYGSSSHTAFLYNEANNAAYP